MRIIKTIFPILPILLFFINSGLASDVRNGKKIYQLHCQMCHGMNGNSSMAGAASFKRGEGLFQSDHSLLQRILNGDKVCPAYRGILSEQDIFDVIAYIRTFYP